MLTRGDKNPRRIAVRLTVLVGLFTGTAVGAGYLLSGVPNVELMTFLVALAGAALGRSLGALCGILAAVVFSLGNPYGAPVPQLRAAQAVGLALARWLGGVTAPVILAALRRGGRQWASGMSLLLGCSATLGFDLLTNLASAWAFGLELRIVVAGAIPFALIHQLGNAPLFLVLYPLLLPRCVQLARPPLRGESGRVLVVALLLLATAGEGAYAAPADSLSAEASAVVSERLDAAVADSLLWQPATNSGADSLSLRGPATDRPDRPSGRPLWDPFPSELLDLLDRQTFYVPVRDGGFGSRLVYLQEASTSPYPLFLQDGVPLTTGHRWADDPNTLAITGLVREATLYGLDGHGGTGGALQFRSADPEPANAYADAHFYAGPHNTKLRSFSFLTPRAPWRLRFDFEETWDQDGYDFSPPGDSRYVGVERRGESKFRRGRGAIERILSDNSSLSLAVATMRKHKTSLPAPGLDHEEIWGDHAALTWRDGTPAGRFRVSLYWSGRDVQRDWNRKVEVLREGVLLQLGGQLQHERLLQLTLADWRVDDSGAGAWADADSGAVHVAGQEASALLALPWRLGGIGGRLTAAGWWNEYGGSLIGGSLTVAPAGDHRWWRLQLERGGRAPRSDELLTPDRSFVSDSHFVLLPNRELEREETLRAGLLLSGSLWGLDLAALGSVRRLREGIVWTPTSDDNTGRWTNDLDMLSHTVTVKVSRTGRAWGWLQLALDAAWRGHDIRRGSAPSLPPEQSAGVEMLWEKRFFHEDGILELGYWFGFRGEMTDPWVPAGLFPLPSISHHDAMLAFRLVGVDLNLELRNLTDQKQQLSAGALSSGRELRWRLQWKFSY